MGYLGKKILKEGLSAAGLTSFLGSQRNNIASAMPNGLAEMIGFEMPEGILDKAKDAVEDTAAAIAGTAGMAVDTAGDAVKATVGAVGDAASKSADVAGDAAKATVGAVGDAASKTADVAGDVAKSGGNMLMKILPLIALLAVIFFAWKMCGDDVKSATGDAVETVGDAANATAGAVGDAANATMDAAGNAAETVGDVVGDAANAVGSAITNLGDFLGRKLSNGIELNIPEFGIENKLLDFLEDSKATVSNDTWYEFDRLTFNTGSATLDINQSQEQLRNLAEIMKAYPNMEIKIGGYTDNTGDAAANLKLSESRANSVKNAIVNLGVDAKRITTEGYGEAHPIASNDTPEGREKNRRVALRFTKK
jgi:outer membrane protein OmpA-like peptidoglycan-associated protein